MQIRNYDVYRMFEGSYEQENTCRINRITNGYKYGTHDRYQDGRPIFIFTWASAETETQTEYIRMYKNGISYTKHINRRGNRNCTEDVNRCMIRKSYMVYINRFITTCVFLISHLNTDTYVLTCRLISFHSYPKFLLISFEY